MNPRNARHTSYPRKPAWLFYPSSLDRPAPNVYRIEAMRNAEPYFRVWVGPARNWEHAEKRAGWDIDDMIRKGMSAASCTGLRNWKNKRKV